MPKSQHREPGVKWEGLWRNVCSLQPRDTPPRTHPTPPLAADGICFGRRPKDIPFFFSAVPGVYRHKAAELPLLHLSFLYFYSFMADKPNLSFCLSGFRGEKLCESLRESLQSGRGLLLNEHMVFIWMLLSPLCNITSLAKFLWFFFLYSPNSNIGIQAWVAWCNFRKFFYANPRLKDVQTFSMKQAQASYQWTGKKTGSPSPPFESTAWSVWFRRGYSKQRVVYGGRMEAERGQSVLTAGQWKRVHLLARVKGPTRANRSSSWTFIVLKTRPQPSLLSEPLGNSLTGLRAQHQWLQTQTAGRGCYRPPKTKPNKKKKKKVSGERDSSLDFG